MISSLEVQGRMLTCPRATSCLL